MVKKRLSSKFYIPLVLPPIYWCLLFCWVASIDDQTLLFVQTLLIFCWCCQIAAACCCHHNTCLCWCCWCCMYIAYCHWCCWCCHMSHCCCCIWRYICCCYIFQYRCCQSGDACVCVITCVGHPAQSLFTTVVPVVLDEDHHHA